MICDDCKNNTTYLYPDKTRGLCFECSYSLDDVVTDDEFLDMDMDKPINIEGCIFILNEKKYLLIMEEEYWRNNYEKNHRK